MAKMDGEQCICHPDDGVYSDCPVHGVPEGEEIEIPWPIEVDPEEYMPADLNDELDMRL